ncbi:MAG: hypothetical protein ABIT58_08860 [Ferruginibacter sp.]
MILLTNKQQAGLVPVFQPMEKHAVSETMQGEEFDDAQETEDETLPDDDENDINGDDAENTKIYRSNIFFTTHPESPRETDPVIR